MSQKQTAFLLLTFEDDTVAEQHLEKAARKAGFKNISYYLRVWLK